MAEKKITPMDKATEIAMLEKLAATDSYFADEFSAVDAATMAANIRNDFPLLTGTEIRLKLDETEFKLNEQREIVDILRRQELEMRSELRGQSARIDALNEQKAETLTGLVKLLQYTSNDEATANLGQFVYRLMHDQYSVDEIVTEKLSKRVQLDEAELQYVLQAIRKGEQG
jgi:hypothetical protein